MGVDHKGKHAQDEEALLSFQTKRVCTRSYPVCIHPEIEKAESICHARLLLIYLMYPCIHM
jgi:hypothetical protein